MTSSSVPSGRWHGCRDSVATCSVVEGERAWRGVLRAGCRVQVAHSPYKGFVDCLVRTVARDGVSALYKSYPTTVRAAVCVAPSRLCSL